MTGIFVPQQQQHNPPFPPSFYPVGGPSNLTLPSAASTSQFTMDPQHPHHPVQFSQSSPIAGPSNLHPSWDPPANMPNTPSTTTSYLPRQVFSSPNEPRYPASTLAAVEASRSRFFARQQSATAPRTRHTPFGSTTLQPSTTTTRRTHKSHPLSSASSASYRQSFFERCQRAMGDSRTSQRNTKIMTFRKGVDGATPGLFSDEMDEDDPPSSPPSVLGADGGDGGGECGEGEREEDDEMTRRRIIAEYSRLKRIYELKGHLEIGWIDPDQLSWLEQVSKREGEQEARCGEEDGMVDPYHNANDEELEQLWLESQQPSQGGGRDVEMQDDREDWDDRDFEEALARLPM
ncbi:uncharacterized protein UDID_02037 [Ustilago sp. UG-2017a]|nr:uncharacterized protein UDID_02037 [Ustilago sp. UG-2017a]